MKQIIQDLQKHMHYAWYAAKASLKSEVADSKLNWIWWILEPFCFMLVYTVVFGYIFNSTEEYRSLFIFLGISIWQFFSRSLKHAVGMLKKNKQIIGKVYLPKYILIIQDMLVNGFKMLICFGISIGLIAFFRVGFHWGMLRIFPIMLSFILFTFGLSCFMMHFGLLFKDLSNITDIVLRFLMYFVGVYYSIDNKVPAPFNEYIVLWNPITFYLNCVRRVMMYNQPVDWMMYAFWTILSATVAYAGIKLIYKNENSYVKVI